MDRRQIEPNLVISTIRNNFATFGKENPIPIDNHATIMDFSWPPSIDKEGVKEIMSFMGWSIGLELLTD